MSDGHVTDTVGMPRSAAARREREDAVAAAQRLQSHPEPLDRARGARRSEIPPAALRWLATANRGGWRDHGATYARGWGIHARLGTPLGLIETVAMRVRMPGTAYRATAVWKRAIEDDGSRSDWVTDGGFGWHGGQVRAFKVTALSDWMAIVTAMEGGEPDAA